MRPLYDHYAWRFLLKEHPDVFGKPLQPDDTWQERFISGADEKAPELRFWLSAATGGDTSSSGTLPPHKNTPSHPDHCIQAGHHLQVKAMKPMAGLGSEAQVPPGATSTPLGRRD